MKQTKFKSAFSLKRISTITDNIEEEIFCTMRIFLLDHFDVNEICELSKDQIVEVNDFMEESAEEKHAHGMIAIGLFHCIREWQAESGIDVIDSDIEKEYLYSDI